MGFLKRILFSDDGPPQPTATQVGSRAAPPMTAGAIPPALPEERSRRRLPPKSERPYASRLCPWCRVEQAKPPKAKRACEACGRPILVRSGADGYVYLLSEPELPGFEATMSRYSSAQADADEAAEHSALVAAGFLVGEDYAEVVGESHYQRQLERVVGGRTEQGAHFRCVARLIREPTNVHDPNAVMVTVDGQTVGYINRDDAEDVAAMVERMDAQRSPAWVPATIVGGWRDSRGSGSFGIELDGLPLYE